LRAAEIAETAEFFSFGTNYLTRTTFGISCDDAGSFLPDYRRSDILEHDSFMNIDVRGVGELVRTATKLRLLLAPPSIDSPRLISPGMLSGMPTIPMVPRSRPGPVSVTSASSAVAPDRTSTDGPEPQSAPPSNIGTLPSPSETMMPLHLTKAMPYCHAALRE
jgi:hypothetical protein